MAKKLIALMVAAVSLTAYGADGTTANNPQSQPSASGQSQSTAPQDKSKPLATTEGGAANQIINKPANSWDALDNGWKQFDQTGK